MATIELDYIAAGGNRHSSASDWSPGLLVFGAGNNIALWNPQDEEYHGIREMLSGHTAPVSAIKIYENQGLRVIISGSADKTVRIWSPTEDGAVYEETQRITNHNGAVNLVAILPSHGLFVTGAADGTILIHRFENGVAKVVQSIQLKPHYLPLAAAITVLTSGSTALAIAGTTNSIQIFCQTTADEDFILQATLTGHEGWIRSLDFTSCEKSTEGDILLASASQDKYIRLWRFRKSDEDNSSNAKKSLSNRARVIGGSTSRYSITFEALLIGHEDWVYSVRWAPTRDAEGKVSLLSASADNSLSIWNVDNDAGIWVCNTRLGEISAQKGSTTATGSTGGFWVGLWQPDGCSVVSLGRTGSWRRWLFDSAADMWQPSLGISGHTREVQSLAWAPTGSYLISTASDQTTRLFGEWVQLGSVSWHEFSRPQIHGYDLNCVATVTDNRFISGADEKLLRVFDKPKAVDSLLSKLSGSESSTSALPDAANIPVLGLSNKAVMAVDDDALVNEEADGDIDSREAIDPASMMRKSTLDISHPPLEDHLARHTLWPEHEKLYGHGYEISTVASSNDRSLVATACKASSLDHAVIRLYDTHHWREIKPSLAAHTLTVTSLAFSPDDRYLLSVGRDRQWAVFERAAPDVDTYTLLASNPKGHSRMILDCCWLPMTFGHVFVTAGRDKAVKLWKPAGGSFDCIATIPASSAVTAIASELELEGDGLRLVYGTEDGNVVLVILLKESFSIVEQVKLDKRISPSAAISSLRWRPSHDGSKQHQARQLAIGGEDHSVRICKVR